jgi:hypothetical protein
MWEIIKFGCGCARLSRYVWKILWVRFALALHVLDRLGLAPPTPPRRRRSVHRASVATALMTASKPNYKLGGAGSPRARAEA